MSIEAGEVHSAMSRIGDFKREKLTFKLQRQPAAIQKSGNLDFGRLIQTESAPLFIAF